MIGHVIQSRNEQIWNEQKEKLLIQFVSLNMEDLNYEAGRKYEMIEKISFKLGKSESEMLNIIQSL
jgi:hypothetical protein